MKKFILLLTCVTMMAITQSYTMFKSDRKQIELSVYDLFSVPNDLIELETLYIYQDLPNSINIAYIHKNQTMGKYLLRHIYSSDGATNAVRNTAREFNSITDAQATLLRFLQNPEAAYYTATDKTRSTSSDATDLISLLTSPEQSPTTPNAPQAIEKSLRSDSSGSIRRNAFLHDNPSLHEFQKAFLPT